MNQAVSADSIQSPPVSMGSNIAARCTTLSTIGMVLSILQFVSCLLNIAASFLKNMFIDFEKKVTTGQIQTTLSHPTLDAAQIFTKKIAIWETLRQIPFILASLLLFWIALRLRRSDFSALRSARTWVLWAFIAIFISLMIQIFVTIPATLEYQRQVAGLMNASHTGSASPIDMSRMFSAMTAALTILGVVFGTLILSVWPVVLYVWSGRILREMPQRTLVE